MGFLTIQLEYFFGDFLLQAGNTNNESGSLAQPGFDLNTTPMACNDLFADGQAQPRAGYFSLGSLDAEKFLEQVRNCLRRDADAGVAD